jgi:tetratricopeptide (TPR) repeat protein
LRKVQRQRRIAEATRIYNAGRYAEAVAEFEIITGAFGKDERNSGEYADFLNNYGSALAETGNLGVAIGMFTTALRIYEALGASLQAANTCFNLGNTYTYLNSWKLAGDSYEKAMHFYREAGDDRGLARAILQDAIFFLNIGVAELAEQRLTELHALNEIVQDDPMLRWSLTFQQARIAGGKGDLDGALNLFREALTYLDGIVNVNYRRETENAILRTKQLLGQTPTQDELDQAGEIAISNRSPRQWHEILALARMNNDHGNFAKAEELYDACLASIDRTRSQLDGNERFKFMELVAEAVHDYSTFLLAEEKVEQALQVSERGQGRALLDLMFRHQIKRQGGRHIRVADNGRVMLDSPSIEEIRSVCSALDLHVLKILVTNSRAVAWFIDAGGEVEGWDCTGTLEPLDRLVNLMLWTDPSDDTGSASEVRATSRAEAPPWEDVEEALADVYMALLPARLRVRLETDAGRLLIIPHRDYFQFPWSALGPRGAPLGERWDIGVSPSIAVAMQLDRRRDAEPWQGLQAFQIPAAAFGGIGERTVVIPLLPDIADPGSPTRFGDLPWTAMEARKVAELTQGISVLGDHATPNALRVCLQAAGILHIASHGYWHGFSDFSFILLASDGESRDGMLRGDQVIDQVTQAELVVLSGCQTGLGQTHPDTYLGLANSFLIAGARCVLVSLWPVRDDSMFAFTECFYRHLCDGSSPAGALRSVQEELHGLLDPWDYAGFVAVGNPFFSTAATSTVTLTEGPALCGGDVVISHGTPLEEIDMTMYADEVQMRSEFWWIDESGMKKFQKR